MVKGKTVGVQRETTSWELADKLARDGLFSIEAYDDTESLQNALVASRIDLGVTDTSFAQSAQLSTRLMSSGVDRLKFKAFGQDDLPSTEDEPTQQYAIAVHKGEIELLGAINATLARAKKDGELASLFKTAVEKYEDPSNTISGAAAASANALGNASAKPPAAIEIGGSQALGVHLGRWWR